MTSNKTPASKGLTLFLMTEKGYHFLSQNAPRYKTLFTRVVVGSDKTLAQDYETEIIRFCEDNDIPCCKKSDHDQIDTEYVMAIAWRWMIRHPEDKIIVFHDSLLPRYRGFAPLINSLINEEPELGVSAIFGAREFDRGDILAQSRVQVSYPVKIGQAIQLVNQCYVEAGRAVLDCLLNNTPLVGRAQDESRATYSLWRDEADFDIDWGQSARRIRRTIDALGHPYKGAATRVGGKVLRIIDAVELEDVVVENRQPGKLLFVEDGKPVVVCGEGLLKILDATFEEGEGTRSLFPLSRFRIRFGG